MSHSNSSSHIQHSINIAQYSKNKPSSALLRSSQERISIGLNKHELKSLADNPDLITDKNSRQPHSAQNPLTISHHPQQNSSKPYYSPTHSSRKNTIGGSAVYNNEKTGAAKKVPMLLSLDTIDFKGQLAASKKVYPLTSKHFKSSYIGSTTNASEKPKKEASVPPKKPSSTKAKGDKMRALLSNYEGIFNQKSPSNREIKKTSHDPDPKSAKEYFMDEPPKKSSLPHNITTPSSATYNSTGSNSYRALASSQPPEQSTAPASASAGYNKATTFIPTVWRDAKKSEVEGDNQVAAHSSEKESDVQSKAQTGQPGYSFNNILIDLASLSHDPYKNVSRISINNINNINTINNTHSTAEDRQPTSHDTAKYPYNDLLTLLNERDEELQRLTKDKNDLKVIVETLVSEVIGLKVAKPSTNDKDDGLENLKQSLLQFLKTTNSDKLEESDIDGLTPTAQQIQKRIQSKKRLNSNTSSLDMENLKHMHRKSFKNSFDPSELFSENPTSSKPKKRSYFPSAALSNDVKGLKGLTSSANFLNAYNIYQRSFSTTGEELLGKKAKESPYSESISKPAKKSEQGNASLLNTKKQGSFKKKGGKLGSKEGSSNKRGLFIETPEEFGDFMTNNLVSSQPKTTTNADLEMLRRKLSQEPNLDLDKIFPAFQKKQPTTNIEKNYDRAVHKSHVESPLGGVSVGEALGQLRDRIGRLLGKYKHNMDVLVQTQETYQDRYDTL